MILLGAQGYKLLQKYKIPVSPFSIIKNKNELAAAIKKLGLPLVLKAISPKIIHKTEAGAIQICRTKEEAAKAFNKLTKLGGYVLGQKFVKGQLVIIGAKTDATFGQVIMFGAGGILVEVLKDVAFRVCPIGAKDAEHMIKEIKAYKVLKGLRGQKPINFSLLKQVLIKTCQLALKEKVKELDINPFIINDKQGFAVDIRIIK